jgi:glutamyl/glutaminyl-tRNA synthetase
LRDQQFESLAICLLHAFEHPDHEQIVEVIARELGFAEISVSHRVAPLIKIVSRGDTTVVDAYLNPVLRRYVSQLRTALGPASQVRIMTSARLEPGTRVRLDLTLGRSRKRIRAVAEVRLAAVARLLQSRTKLWADVAGWEHFFADIPAYDDKAAKKNLTAEAAPLLQAVRDSMAELTAWQAPALHVVVQAVATDAGVALGKVAQPVRVAVSGGSVSPPIDLTLAILGRETTLQRLDRAIVHCAR